jgi:hypothetical protein
MLRYYPSFRVKTDLITNGSQFQTISGPYRGKYYMGYDGRKFTGANPIVGPGEELFEISNERSSDISNVGNNINLPENIIDIIESNRLRGLKKTESTKGAPTPYFPIPTESDYTKGYILRSFIKKVNDLGFITEISPIEYANFQNGTVDYDVSYYLTYQIRWKLTGPLNSKRVGQYDVRAGIIDTNKRLVETANNTFLGIKEFIGENYSKFARSSTL